MTLKVTILGCGSSGGVPRVGGDWGVCDPENPKNCRTRCSILVEKWNAKARDVPYDKRTSVIVDTSPDLRQQCLQADISRLDAVLYTHDHADQSHGIDDLRAIAYRMRKRLLTYMDAHTKTHLFNRFEYCFEMPDGRVHPPILELQPLIDGGDRLSIDGPGGALTVDVITLSHGPTPSLGFIFDGTVAYTPDVKDIPNETFNALDGIDTWIIDALRYNDHPTHVHADRTLSWLARTRTRHGILTNLHIDMDYETLSGELLPAQSLAYDGREIFI